MNINASLQRNHIGVGFQVIKWSVFAVELVLLCLLLMVAFLVPVPPFRWGKLPQETLIVMLSVIAAAVAGTLFLRGRESSTISLKNIVSTPPCVVAITVITIVIVPLLIGALWK